MINIKNNTKKVNILVLILSLLLSINWTATASTKTNYSIIDSLNNDFLNEIEDIIKINKIDQFSYQLTDKFQINVLENKAQLMLNKHNIQITNNKLNKLSLSVNNLKIQYDQTQESKLLRTIKYSLFYQLKLGTKNYTNQLDYNFADTIQPTEINNIENIHLKYTIGLRNYKEEDFIDTILEPFLIIGSAILTGILLFTLRS